MPRERSGVSDHQRHLGAEARAGTSSLSRDILTLIYVAVALSNLSFVLIHWSSQIWSHNWGLWIDLYRSKGLVAGYYAADDVYPPLTFCLLAGLSSISGDTYLNFKLAQLLFIFISVLIVLVWSRNGTLSIGILLALTPNSIVFDSIDVFFTPMLIGALIAAMRRRWVYFSALYTAALLVKYQPIVLAPFFLVWILPDLRRGRTWAELILPAGLVLSPVVAAFGPNFIWSLTKAAGAHMYFSGNAFNLNWIIGTIYVVFVDGNFRLNNILDLMSPPALPIWMWTVMKSISILSYAAVVGLFVLSRRMSQNLLLFAGFGMLSYCMLHTEVHENHLHVAVVCFALLATLSHRAVPTFVFWSAAQAVNLMVTLMGWPRTVLGVEWSLLVASGNVAMFLSLYVDVVRTSFARGREPFLQPPSASHRPSAEDDLMPRRSAVTPMGGVGVETRCE